MTTYSLRQVMATYRGLPTDQLVSDTVILTSSDADAVRWAAAATLGFSRAGYYLDTARSLMDQIVSEAKEISWNMKAYEGIMGELRRPEQKTMTTPLQVKASATFMVGSFGLSVHAEILWHFYALSLQHAWYFMEHSAKTIDPAFTRTKNAEDYLELLRAFRNHMEHRDQATGNISSAHWLSMSIQEQQSVTMGYRRDHENNISFVPTGKGSLVGVEQQMPVNPDGFAKFESLIIDTYEHLKKKCLERLEFYFTDHPNEMPSIDQVGQTVKESLELVKIPGE